VQGFLCGFSQEKNWFSSSTTEFIGCFNVSLVDFISMVTLIIGVWEAWVSVLLVNFNLMVVSSQTSEDQVFSKTKKFTIFDMFRQFVLLSTLNSLMSFFWASSRYHVWYGAANVFCSI
jgi:hypothetical protein